MRNPSNLPKILITGSTGLIGQALVRELIVKNQTCMRLPVRNIEKGKEQLGKIPNFDCDSVEFTECDLTQITDQEFDRLTEGCQSVIHLAGLVHQPQATEEEYNLLNVAVTEKLIGSAVRNRVNTFIFISSMAVYGPGPFTMVLESAPLVGEIPYATSKIHCEQMLEKADSFRRTVILRPALIFGSGDKGNLIKLIRSINKGQYFNISNGRTNKSVIFASDAAAAINLCLDKLPAGKHVFNLANPQPVSMGELSRTIALALASDTKIFSLPEFAIRTMIKTADAVMPAHLRKKIPASIDQINKLTTTTTCSVDKLVQATGFAPRYSLLAALASEICWAKNNNLLN